MLLYSKTDMVLQAFVKRRLKALSISSKLDLDIVSSVGPDIIRVPFRPIPRVVRGSM